MRCKHSPPVQQGSRGQRLDNQHMRQSHKENAVQVSPKSPQPDSDMSACATKQKLQKLLTCPIPGALSSGARAAPASSAWSTLWVTTAAQHHSPTCLVLTGKATLTPAAPRARGGMKASCESSDRLHGFSFRCMYQPGTMLAAPGPAPQAGFEISWLPMAAWDQSGLGH